MTKLRNLLGSLYKVAPLKQLKARLDEVDQDIIHIKKNMADHPPRRRTELEMSVTASESASVRMIRTIQLESERRARNRRARGQSSSQSKGSRRETPKSSPSKPLPDLSGSDIDPPSAKIKYSIRSVEDWIRRNDALMGVFNQSELNNSSMVSVIGGGIKKRPAIDAGIWPKASGLGSLKSRFSSRSSIDARLYKIPMTQLSNCVYDKPSHDLYLDTRIFLQVAELVGRTDLKHQFQRTLSSTLQRRKAEKLSKRCKISLSEAIQFLEAQKRRCTRKDLMSGGRSSGPSPRTSLETVVNSSLERASFESAMTDSVLLTASEVQKCVKKAGLEIKMNENLSTSSSLFSIRPSATNLGSLLQQSASVARGTAPLPQGQERQGSTSSSVDGSRPSAVSFGSLASRPQSPKGESQENVQRLKPGNSKEATRMDSSSHKPTSPVVNGWPLSSVASKSVDHLRRDDRQTSKKPFAQAEQDDGCNPRSGFRKLKQVQQSKVPYQERTQDVLPSMSTYVQSRNYDTSDAAQNASGSRAERRQFSVNDDTLGSGRGREEPSQLNSSDRVRGPPRGKIDAQYIQPKELEVSDAIKNSRRRRAERGSVPFIDRYRNEERKKVWISKE